MRLAILAAVLIAIPAAVLADSPSPRLDRRIEKALADSNARAESQMKEILERELHPGSSLAVIRSAVTFDACREGVTYLAGDELGGRDTGSEGHRKATEWAAGVFKEAGLEAVGDGGTYFQGWRFGKKATRNVVAFLRGETDELVVVGAHLDHIGTGAPGFFSGRIPNPLAGDDQIYNGADDNASGSTAVVMMAKALGALKRKPKRGVLFILFAGEEKGLLGSGWYVGHPIFPLEKTVAMINLDMVGRNRDHACEVLGAEGSPELRSALETANKRIGMNLTVRTTQIFAQSDQLAFYQKKIPCLFFTSGGHPQYHTALDHPDLINFGKIEEVAELGASLVLRITRLKTRPTFRSIPGLGPRLGVTPANLTPDQCDDLGIPKDEGGVLLNAVMEKFPAAAAGLRAGDVVVSIDGKPLPRKNALDEFRQKIMEAKPGAKQKFGVMRGGMLTTVTVKYPKD